MSQWRISRYNTCDESDPELLVRCSTKCLCAARMFVTMSVDEPFEILSVSPPLHFGKPPFPVHDPSRQARRDLGRVQVDSKLMLACLAIRRRLGRD